MQPAKRIRLRSKTNCGPQQSPLIFKESEYAAEEIQGARKSVYLLTFPHPRKEASKEGVILVAPGTLTRKALLEKVKDCFKNPIYVDMKSIEVCGSIPLYNAAVFLEILPAAC